MRTFKQFGFFGLLSCLFSIVYIVSCQSEDKKPKVEYIASFQAGIDYHHSGKYDSAIICLTKFEEQAKKTSDTGGLLKAMIYIVDSYRLIGNIKKASSTLKRAWLAVDSLQVKDESTLADLHEAQCNIFFLTNDLPKSREEINLAINLRRKAKGEADSTLASYYNTCGLICHKMGDDRSALSFFQKALTSAESSKMKNSALLASYCYYTAVTLKELGEIRQAFEFFHKSFQYQKQSKFHAWLNTPELSISYGAFLIEMGLYQEALNYYDSVEIVFKQENQLQQQAYTLLRLYKGSLLIIRGDYNEALSCYQQVERVCQENLKNDRLIPLSTSNSIAICFQHQEKYKEALQYYKKCLLYKPDYKAFDYANILNGMASCYAALSLRDSANAYYKLTILERIKTYGPKCLYLASDYVNYAALCVQNKNYKKAERLYHLALNTYTKSFGSRHPEIADCLGNLGDLYLKMGNFKMGMNYIQLGIIANTKDFGSMDYDSLPDASQVTSSVQMITLLNKKCQALQEYYNNNKHKGLSPLLTCLQNYDFSFLLTSQLIRSYYAEESSLFLTDKVKDNYVRAVEIAVQLFDRTQNSTYQDKAFQFSEEGRSFMVRSSMAHSSAISWNGVPDTIREKEKFLKDLYTAISASLETERNLSLPKRVRLNNLEYEKYGIKESLNKLHHFLESKYPTYYRLQYANKTIDPAEIMSQLKLGQCLAEFLLTDSVLISFIFTKNEFETLRRKVPAGFTEEIREYLEHFRDFEPGRFTEKDNQKFLSSSFSLYKFVLEPILCGRDINQLIIIPDGILSLISFESLVTQDVALSKTWSRPSYVLKKCNITYQYTAGQIMNHKSIHLPHPTNLLAIAPFCQDDKGAYPSKTNNRNLELTPLPYSKEEVMSIRSIFGGDALFGNQATKSVFSGIAANYDIIHFATHAKMSVSDKDSSLLYLHPDYNSDGIIRIEDIPGLNLNAQLVVLSACGTGTGKIRKGEGVLSLAHAFACANCPSVITTLWSIGDQSTKNIMDGFYQGLAKGLSKSEALRQAKLNYLKKADPLHNQPFYWASFVCIGNDEPIQGGEMKANTKVIYLVLMLPALLLLLIFYQRHKRHSKEIEP